MIAVATNTEVEDTAYLDDEGEMEIGHECHISKGVVIFTHNHGEDKEWWKPSMALEKIRNKLVIGNNVFIGRNVIITTSCHRIGNRVTIGAGSVVTHDIPDNEIWAGNTARKIGEYENSLY